MAFVKSCGTALQGIEIGYSPSNDATDASQFGRPTACWSAPYTGRLGIANRLSSRCNCHYREDWNWFIVVNDWKRLKSLFTRSLHGETAQDLRQLSIPAFRFLEI
jgi:hypothetical protein